MDGDPSVQAGAAPQANAAADAETYTMANVTLTPKADAYAKVTLSFVANPGARIDIVVTVKGRTLVEQHIDEDEAQTIDEEIEVPLTAGEPVNINVTFDRDANLSHGFAEVVGADSDEAFEAVFGAIGM